MSIRNRIIFLLLTFLLTTILISSLSAQDSDDITSLSDVAENAEWGENVTITVNIADDEPATFTFESDGLPTEYYGGYLDFYVYKDRNGDGIAAPVSVEHEIEIPLVPELNETGEFIETAGGTIGIIVSGAVLYNPYEGGPDTDVYAIEDNFYLDGVPFIDSCSGHPDVPGRDIFHYHSIPVCVTDVLDVEGEHSTLIGYLFDGFPIYGSQDVDGDTPEDLNECSAHFGPTPEFPDGIWHYHLTDERPYSIDCYIGVLNESIMQGVPSNSQNGQDGNSPQGNPPPAGQNGEGGNPPPPRGN